MLRLKSVVIGVAVVLITVILTIALTNQAKPAKAGGADFVSLLRNLEVQANAGNKINIEVLTLSPTDVNINGYVQSVGDDYVCIAYIHDNIVNRTTIENCVRIAEIVEVRSTDLTLAEPK
jgi:hypothetical protein